MKYLEYPLFAEGYVNRFLVTGVFTEVKRFTKATLKGRVNEWLKKGFAIHENPCRKEFLAERREQIPEYRELSGALNGDEVEAFGTKSPLRIYFPFGNTGVDASGFYYRPTWLRMYAYTCLWAEKAGVTAFELETCGGATVWANGERIVDFTPFTRNLVKRTEITIPLKEGNNHLVVCLDDLAERDTDYYFRLKALGGPRLSVRIPAADDVDPAVLERMEASLDQMCFDKEAYISELVELSYENPFERELPLDVIVTPGEFIEKMRDAWKMIQTRRYTLAPRQKKVELFSSDEISPGYYYFTGRLEYKGIEMKRKIGNQLVRKEFLLHREERLEDRKRAAMETVVRFAPENTYKAAVLFALGRDKERAEAILLEELEGVNDRRDCSDFHFIIMLYIYHTFRDQISRRLLEELESAMIHFRYWIDEPGDDVMWFFSENHALLFHCLQYLAGSYLPDRLFVNSGKTGAEVKRRGEELLDAWFEDFFREFITEWNSNAYIPVDVLGIGTLYNLTEKGDPLHQKAKKALDMIFYSLSVNAHKGAVMTSFGRTYEKEMKGNYNAGTTSLLYIAYNAGYLNRACIGYLPLILGDYEAPEEYQKYTGLAEGQSLAFANTQGFEGHVNLYLYKNSRALLSTAVGFKPFRPGYQEHIVQAVIDETAQAFVNHPGEAFPYGSGRPAFWAGNGTLPMAAQYGNTSIVRYRIPETERIDYTHMYAPLSEFASYKGEDGILILEKDGAYIGVRALNGLEMQKSGPNRFREFISRGRDNVWVIRVGSMEEYGALDNLLDALKRFEISREGEMTLVTDEKGISYRMDPEKLLLVDGKPVYQYPESVSGRISLGGDWK